ncbi:MAG: DOPA 4,5-dioxygenase family protein [Rhodospirillales bacterium]|nr:DOPA 4,5-dioxygenase family protein [Rhodospirillales bacterium]
MPQNPNPSITGFHAHVYYDADSKERAARLRSEIEDRFTVEMGRWHDRPIGPHLRWSYQVAFTTELFGDLVPWLALNRDSLVIFVHPCTGDDIPDHRDFALWLGEKVELNLDALK